MDSSNIIQLGSHSIPQVRYEDVEPGDFVCSYEYLTTRLDLLFIQFAHKITSFSTRPSAFGKMFHTAVILEKYPRSGVYKIAHGAARKMFTQIDHLKDHHPGQAFLVFRAKEKGLQKEIIHVATKTSEPDNGHICKTLDLDHLKNKMVFLFNFFLYENLKRNSDPITMRKIAEMVKNFNQSGKFFGDDRTGYREMNCVHYISSIINIATIRFLAGPTPTLSKMRELSHTCPWKCSRTNTTPASFVDAFLHHPHIRVVGYLGALHEPVEGPKLDTKGKKYLISTALIGQLFASLELPNINSTYAAKVMMALGMVEKEWLLNSITLQDIDKIKTLLVFVYANFSHLPKEQQKRSLNFDVLIPLFQEKAKKILIVHGKDAQFPQDIDVENLTFFEEREILFLEREYLQSNMVLSRTDKTLKLSLNYFAAQMVTVNKIRSCAKLLLFLGEALTKTLLLTPFSLVFTFVASILNDYATTKENHIKTNVETLLTLHEKVRKNGHVILSSKSIPQRHRPWIHYSINKGRYDVEPFVLEDSVWRSSMKVPPKGSIAYRIFIGPIDLQDPNPLEKTVAWQRTSDDNYLMTVLDNTRSPIITEVKEPAWQERSLIFSAKSSQFSSFAHKCHQAGSTEDTPSSIQEYEEVYTNLENTLEPFPYQDLPQDEMIQHHLTTFLKQEIGLDVTSEQIQYMRGGLGKGLSGDRIYKICDPLGSPQYIVKIFMKSHGRCAREFFSLVNHEKLKLKTLAIPTATGICAAQMGDKRIYFLVMNHIAGTTVYDLFMELLSQPQGSVKRDEIAQKLRYVYTKLGQGIAEFHQASRGEPKPLHPAFRDLLEQFCKKALERLQKDLPTDFWSKLQKYFRSKAQTEFGRKFVRGYHHGDINAGNLIYNEVLGKLWMIDWPDGSFSVGKDGIPLGIPFYDLIQIKNEFLNRKAQGLLDAEANPLYEAFITEYVRCGGTLPSPETMEFFSAIDLMGSLKWFVDKKNMFEGEQLKAASEINRIKQKELEKIVEPYTAKL